MVFALLCGTTLLTACTDVPNPPQPPTTVSAIDNSADADGNSDLDGGVRLLFGLSLLVRR
jgi:hypothetical protein